jgi:hypothetical protein
VDHREQVLRRWRGDRRVLSSRKIAIAITTTYQPTAFDSEGNVTDAGPAMRGIMSADASSRMASASVETAFRTELKCSFS